MKAQTWDEEEEQQIISPGSLHVYSAVSCGAQCGGVLCVLSRSRLQELKRRKSEEESSL